MRNTTALQAGTMLLLFQILPDGGFILSESSDGEGYLIHTNSDGETLWTRLYPDATADCIKVQSK